MLITCCKQAEVYEVSVNSPRVICGVSPEEEKVGCSGKDLQKGKFALLTMVGIWKVLVFFDFVMDLQYSSLCVNLLSKPSL